MGKKKIKIKKAKVFLSKRPALYGHWGIILFCFVIWVFIVSRNYYSQHPVHLGTIPLLFHWQLGELTLERFSLFLSYFCSLILLGLILSSAFFVGRRILKYFKFQFSSVWEDSLFSIGLGFGILAYTTLLLGFLGLLYKWVFFGIIIVLALFSIIEVYKILKSNPYPSSQPLLRGIFKLHFPYILISVVLLILTGINFLMAFVPELFYDSLVYHLGIPNYYIIHHKILPLKYAEDSFYPFNLEMLYTIGLLLQGGMVAKLIHFSSGILALLTILTFCRRYLNDKIGIIACAIFYSVPIVAMNSWTTGNDVGLAFFVMLGLYAMVNWFEGEDDLKKWFALSAVFAGLAMGVKYPAIIVVGGMIGSVFFWDFWKQEVHLLGKVKKIAVFGLIILAVFSPWLIRNFVFIENPVYPFFYHLTQESPLAITLGRGNNYFVNIFYRFSKIYEVFVSPWRLTMEGHDSLHFIGPMFLLFVPWMFFIKEKKKLFWQIFIFCMVSYIFFFLATPKPRYLMGTFPALGIIFGYGLVTLSNKMPKYIGKLVIITFTIFLITNVYSIAMIIHSAYSPFKVLTGLESRDAYLSYTHLGIYPNPSYKVIKYVNDNLPKSVKVLIVGDEKVYYLKRDFAWNEHNNRSLLIEWTGQSQDGEELYKKLRQEKITHILLNVREEMRLKYGFYKHKEGLEVFNDFWESYVKEIYHAEGTYLYEILSEEEASKPHPVPINFLAELEKRDYKPGSIIYIYRDYKNWDGMIEEYMSGLRLGADVYGPLGWCYLQKGDYKTAKEMYQKALTREPQNEQYYKVLEELDCLGIK